MAEKCWVLHSVLQLKDRRQQEDKKGKKVILVAQEGVIKLPKINEPDDPPSFDGWFHSFANLNRRLTV